MDLVYSNSNTRVHNTSTAYRPHPHYRNVTYKKYGERNYNQNFNHKNYEKQEHWCETCDKGFYTVQQLLIHTQEHQKCNIDGCQFVAHPKVITKHIQMQHSTGLYSKISRLNDPEEIKKWKEERKMKYPTKENIARKAAEIAEKLQRGERMGLQKNNSKQANGNKRKSTMKNNHRPRKQKKLVENVTNTVHRKDTLHQSKRREFMNLTTISEKQDNSNYSLKPFTGIQNFIIEDEDPNTEQHSELVLDIDDNEWTENMSYKTPKEDISCNALSNLICNYGSDNEPENVPNNNDDIKENSQTCPKFNQESTMTSSINEKDNITLSDDSGPEEVKIDKKQIGLVDECIKEQKEIPRKQIRHNIIPLVPKYNKSKLPSTLLQKLLFKEMRHERNVTLQCIRYIIKNNYFFNHSIK